MKRIIFYNLKGGVCKTTSATSVAHIMAAKYNLHVLLVDLDPQANSSQMFSTVSMEGILEKHFINKLSADRGRRVKREGLENRENDICSLLVDTEDVLDPHSVVKHTRIPNLDIIPGTIFLNECETQIRSDFTPQHARLRNKLEGLDAEYDYCIIDCSPSESIININGLVAADELYIPIKADGWSMIGMLQAYDLANTVRKFYNPGLKVGGVYFALWNMKTGVSQYCVKIAETYMPENLMRISDASSEFYESWVKKGRYLQQAVSELELRKPEKDSEEYAVWEKKLADTKKRYKSSWAPACGEYISIRRSADMESASYLQAPILEGDPQMKKAITADLVLLTDYILNHNK